MLILFLEMKNLPDWTSDKTLAIYNHFNLSDKSNNFCIIENIPQYMTLNQ